MDSETIKFIEQCRRERGRDLASTMDMLRATLKENEGKFGRGSKGAGNEDSSFSFGGDGTMKGRKSFTVVSKMENNPHHKGNHRCTFYDNRCFGLSMCF